MYLLKNGKMRGLIILLLVALIVAFPVAGGGVINLCKGDTSAIPLVFNNILKSQVEYKILLEGEASTFSRATSTGFLLNPGETKNVFVYTTPTFSVPIGTYELSITEKTVSYSRTNTYNVNVQECVDFSTTLLENYDFLCKGGKGSLDLIIKNIGKEENTYSIYSNNIVKLAEESLIIPQNRAMKTTLTLLPTKEGNQTVKIEVVPEKGVQKSVSLLNFYVKNCYGNEINSTNLEICAGHEGTHTATLRNLGEFPENYELSLVAPVWFKMETINETSLEAKTTKTIRFNVNPPAESANDYEVTIKAKGISGTAESTINVKVLEEEECYGVEISAEDIKMDLNSSSTSTIKIKNKEEETKNYTINLYGSGANMAELNKRFLTLEPYSEGTVGLLVEPQSKPGKYSLAVVISEDGNKVGEKALNLEVGDTGVMLYVKYGLYEISVAAKSVARFIYNGIKSIVKKLDLIEIKITDNTTVTTCIEGEKVASYSTLNELKYYIIAGIVILVVIILILSYYKKVLDFFEEGLDEKFEEELQKQKEVKKTKKRKK